MNELKIEIYVSTEDIQKLQAGKTVQIKSGLTLAGSIPIRIILKKREEKPNE